jgi:cyclopropane-fatty-acyl-phospholipid synthase
MILLPRRVSPVTAVEILHRIFGGISTSFAFRLWDGTRVTLGGGTPVCTAVVGQPETFIRLMRDPSPLNFAEAYVEGALDIEGDLFAAMAIADSMEDIRLSFAERMRILVAVWRG